MSDPQTVRPCVEQYGPHDRHTIDCATVQEWNTASRTWAQEMDRRIEQMRDDPVAYVENARKAGGAR